MGIRFRIGATYEYSRTPPMDDVSQIKARLPIEQLVGGYCQLIKKGRNFVCLCPFHNDSKPSLLVSPDKGIAYCFACQSGGDIFSFYQRIEGVDFPTSIRDLAERAGVKLEMKASFQHAPKKDEKDRARECLRAALSFYQERLKADAKTQDYLRSRVVPEEQIAEFEIGLAPEGFQTTYDHLLKAGFSKTEIIAAGLAVQRDLQEDRPYDRFRSRLMFPIQDAQGLLVGFGGRTLSNDDAKYVNSNDGILYHKSAVLYALHHAKEAMREAGKAVIVEGYFDVLACHRVGIKNTVAACGTALTEQHCKLLRRYAPTVLLCLDSDRAGQEATERAFPLLCAEGLHVEAVMLPGKDPSEILARDPEELKTLLNSGSAPYLDIVLRQIQAIDLTNVFEKRQSLSRFLRLLRALSSAVERDDYLRKAAAVFQTTDSALQQDLRAMEQASVIPRPKVQEPVVNKTSTAELFSAAEIALGLFCFYPKVRHLAAEMIEPQDAFIKALFGAVKQVSPESERISIDDLILEDNHRERAALLLLYVEHHGLVEWSESLAVREIHKNCRQANRDFLHIKQQEITRRLVDARMGKRIGEEAELLNQYQEVLKLMQKTR